MTVRGLLMTAPVALVAVGCSEPEVRSEATGGDVPAAPTLEAMVDTPPETVEAPPEEAPTLHDNHSFDRARAIEPGDGTTDTIGEAGEEDYYSFEADPGAWVSIKTSYESLGGGDTIVTLFDAGFRKLATNDDAARVVGQNDVDSQLVTRLEAGGTYYVRIHDERSSPARFEGNAIGAGFYVYTLNVDVLGDAVPGVTIHGSAAETETMRIAAREFEGGTTDHGWLLGAFESGEAQGFAFDVVGELPLAVTTRVLADGVDGNGSPATPHQVWIVGPNGQTIARVDVESGQDFIAPSLHAGSYELWIAAAPDSGAGFYAMSTHFMTENPREADDATNGDIARAELLPREDTTRASYLLTHVGGGDLDYFAFDATAGERVSVFCSSTSDGSGLVDLRVEIRDDADEPLAAGVELPIALLALEDVDLPTDGQYYLRFSKTDQLQDVIGDWVRCGMFPR